MAFLSEAFASPKTYGDYTKLVDGESLRLRILSEPIFYWEFWKNKKQARIVWDGSSSVEAPSGYEGEKGKFTWAMIVWNYDANKLQIWAPAQKVFLNNLESFAKDKDIGDPMTFDIKISRKGSTIDNTEYSIMPLQKSENMKEMDKAILEKAKKIRLNELILNGNPFDSTLPEVEDKNDPFKSKISIEDVPFA